MVSSETLRTNTYELHLTHSYLHIHKYNYHYRIDFHYKGWKIAQISVLLVTTTTNLPRGLFHKTYFSITYRHLTVNYVHNGPDLRGKCGLIRQVLWNRPQASLECEIIIGVRNHYWSLYWRTQKTNYIS